MMQRNLKVGKDQSGMAKAQFAARCPDGTTRIRTVRITPGEYEKAKKIIERGDEYEIDYFCYCL